MIRDRDTQVVLLGTQTAYTVSCYTRDEQTHTHIRDKRRCRLRTVYYYYNLVMYRWP